ncbi:MAG: glycosyltransferase [Truepera sp.]|nr:glycosyltransferase [Truepera sp.]
MIPTPLMPTVIINTLLSFVKDSSYALRGPDTVGVIIPMYNEEAGARRALESLIYQEQAADELVVSINGGRDATLDVVLATLRENGYALRDSGHFAALQAEVQQWHHPSRVPVTVVNYPHQTAKADSINNAVLSGLLTSDRVLVVDGDTLVERSFIRELRHHFYRLTIRHSGGKRQVVIEDYGVQSGAVMSYAEAGDSPAKRFVSLAREAEYAFGCMLKTGQAKQLPGSPLGSSRLYTVVGCGFVARRELFPMPSNTKTEDHDFTLAAQNVPPSSGRVALEALQARGFRVVIDGLEHGPQALLAEDDDIVLVKSGHARFVERARTYTQDPPHLNGYVNQVERWHGGGQQNFLKRFGGALRGNVRYTVWSSLAENLAGVLLVSLIPLGLALNYGNPSIGLPPATLLLGLLIDLIMTALLVGYGFYRYARAPGASPAAALWAALGNSLRTLAPYILLRYLNPLIYLASAWTVFPEFIRERRGRVVLGKAAWERPKVRRASATQRLLGPALLGLAIGAWAAAGLAPRLNPVNAQAWRLVNSSSAAQINALWEAHDFKPGATLPALSAPEALVSRGGPELLLAVDKSGSVSAYCHLSFTSNIAKEKVARRTLAAYGQPENYRPLGPGHLLTLARLAPLAGLLDTAAQTYDVSGHLLLRVLINESYLDPLAVGPTGDYGLSQKTADAIAMLEALSSNPLNRLFNPRLFATPFDLFDPDFSICAGAAKLAWAVSQPEATSDRKAYALYINPLHGLVNGRLSPIHEPLTESIIRLVPMVQALADLFAAHEYGLTLTDTERQLMAIATATREGHLSVEQAYRQVYQVVLAAEIPDAEMYERLFAELFVDYYSSNSGVLDSQVP